jgi:hypothetical protein
MCVEWLNWARSVPHLNSFAALHKVMSPPSETMLRREPAGHKNCANPIESKCGTFQVRVRSGGVT